MSYRLVDAVFTMRLTSSQKFVLLALCRHAWDDGSNSRASVSTLAMETGLSEATVHRTLRQLQKQWGRRYKKHVPGPIIIAVSGKGGGKHSQTVNYRVLLPNFDVIAALLSTYKSHKADDGTGVTMTPVDSATGATMTGTGVTMTPTGVTMTDESVLNRSLNRSKPTSEAVTACWDGAILELGMAPPNKLKPKVDRMLEEFGPEVMRTAMGQWVKARPYGFVGLKQPWAAFVKEMPAYCRKRQKVLAQQRDYNVTQEMLEEQRRTLGGDLDLNYYRDRLNEARGAIEMARSVMDPKTIIEREKEIAELKAKVTEMENQQAGQIQP